MLDRFVEPFLAPAEIAEAGVRLRDLAGERRFTLLAADRFGEPTLRLGTIVGVESD